MISIVEKFEIPTEFLERGILVYLEIRVNLKLNINLQVFVINFIIINYSICIRFSRTSWELMALMSYPILLRMDKKAI